MLLALKKNGGVIQLCILNDYIKQAPPNPARDQAFEALHRELILVTRDIGNVTVEVRPFTSAALGDYLDLLIRWRAHARLCRNRVL